MSLDNFLSLNLPFPLSLLPDNTYLVGGAVRDILLNRRRDYLDLDFVVPHDAIAIAQNIARSYHGGFVVLDQERNIARVVFPIATIDIAQQEGESIYSDLSRRDYTLNAIAFDCQHKQIIDPLKGQQDLEKGIIRMVSAHNLQEDPLRLLRAYRQACQLSFQIESNTRHTIKELAPLLSNVAVERINTELGYLLKNERGSNWLEQAFIDHLLSVCFPKVNQRKISLLHQIDQAIDWLKSNHDGFSKISLQELGLAKLACLTDANPDVAEEQLINLKYSRQEIKTVTTILQHSPDLRDNELTNNLRNQYFFFKSVGKNFPAVAIFALAHDADQNLILMLSDRYYNEEDIVAHPHPLLTGNDLIQSCQLSPSPLIGELLTEVQIAQIEGIVANKEDAIVWIQQKLNCSSLK